MIDHSSAELEALRLSKLLFEARESISDWADVAENATGRRAIHERRLVAEIDAFRSQRGWNPDGFGGEPAS